MPNASKTSFEYAIWAAAAGAAGAVVAGTTLASASDEPNWKAIREEIASSLDASNYDDGSYGPVYVRLAWHASGTYDKHTKTGGSNGATMRFAPESEHGANAGLVSFAS